MHPTDDVRVRNKFAASFVAAGFEVTWVGPDHAYFDQDSKNDSGIRFRLVTGEPGALKRIARLWKLARIVRRLKRVDVLYSPDPDAALLATLLADGHGASVVFDIHEVFHTYMLSRWLGGRSMPVASKLVLAVMEWICRRCALVVGTCESTLAPYRQSCRNHLIVRGCAPAWFAEGEPAAVASSGRNTFRLFHGKTGADRGTNLVLAALGLVAQSARQVRVVLIDRFRDMAERTHFWQEVDRIGIRDMIVLLPGVRMQEMVSLLRTCDVGLVAYDRGMGMDTLANRPFEYMAAGLPLLVPEYSREIADIVRAEQCGLLADFEDARSVSEGILELLKYPEKTRQMGLRARQAFLERHNWDSEVKPLLNWMSQRVSERQKVI